jgi:predicted secreted protein
LCGPQETSTNTKNGTSSNGKTITAWEERADIKNISKSSGDKNTMTKDIVAV